VATRREITQLGNPILRQRAKDVANVSDSRIQTLIDDMILTMHHGQGVGLAAPQVSEPYRIFIVASQANERYPDAPDMEPLAMINPKLNIPDAAKVKDWEGCLSIPGIRGLVPRRAQIEVEYLDRQGKKVKGVFDDFIARIIQHEHDHLVGVVFLDRLDSTQDLITELEYYRLLSNIESHEV
jgi:peptide deformylase